ncbi:SMAD/FHA domain-containing protein [Euphorbia peplus]|nr:SMAD/FHA domain-containing protein [Euphorbia peplus]
MEARALKLVIISGPRKGETLDFEPRSTIRIGRVIRGNNITIKDSGISSKHLLIGSESGKWTVQDLDSSNGTALNSAPLPPFTPFDLRDGDIVKLGEVTSIVVHFHDMPSQVRRNPRRNNNAASGSKGRGKIEENVGVLEEVSAPVVEIPRRGRPRKCKVLDTVPEVELPKPEVNESGEDDSCVIVDKELEVRDSVVVIPEMESANVRVTRSRRNVKPLVSENLGGDGGVVKRLGRGRRKDVQQENVRVGVDEPVNEGEREKANEVEVTGDQNVMDEGLKESGDKVQVNDNEKENVGLGKEHVNENENAGLGQETCDLEKMTMGQWLDFMEVYMPKRITQASEAMIEEMRKKAERVAEYVIEQKKAKSALLKEN